MTKGSPILREKKKILKRILKFFTVIILAVVLLVFGTLLVLQASGVQAFLGTKASEWLSARTGARISVGRVLADLNQVKLQNVHISEPSGDTLLFAGLIHVGYDLTAVFGKTIRIHDVDLERVRGNIHRKLPDTTFNFAFITAAFAGDTANAGKDIQEIADTTGSEWRILGGSLHLRDIIFTYDDDVSGIDLRLILDHLEADLGESDFMAMDLHLKELFVSGSQIAMTTREGVELPEENTPEAPLPSLNVGTIQLEDVRFSMDERNVKGGMEILVGKLKAKAKKTDLNNLSFSLSEISLVNSAFGYSVSVAHDTLIGENSTDDPSSVANKFHIQVEKMDLENNSFDYNDTDAPFAPRGIDFAHIGAKSIGLQASGIDVDEKSASLQLKQLKFREQSGFELIGMKADISYDQTSANIGNLRLRTGNSLIRKDISLRYSSPEAIADSLEDLLVRADLEAELGAEDLVYFAPGLLPDSLARGRKVTLLLQADGSLASLDLSKLLLSTPGLSLHTNGHLKNLLIPEQLYAEIPQFEMHLEKEKIRSLLRQFVPAGLNIPEKADIKATVTGYATNADATVDLTSSAGALYADLKMNPAAGNTEQPYKLELQTRSLNVGYLLGQQPVIGKISLALNVKGEGMDTSKLNASIDLHLNEAELIGYSYHDLTVSGRINKRSFTAEAVMSDPNLAFTAVTHCNLDPASPEYHIQLVLGGADLRNLNIVEQELRVSTAIQADIAAPPGKNFTGSVKISDFRMRKDGRNYFVDSLVMYSERLKDEHRILVSSEVLSAKLQGKYQIGSLAPSLIRHLNNYYQLNAASDTAVAPQAFTFSLQLTDPTIFTSGLVPGLQSILPFKISSDYNSEEKVLQLEGILPRIVYNDMVTDSLRLNLSGDPHQLSFAVTMSQLTDSSLRFENIALTGEAANDQLGFHFTTSRDESVRVLDFKGKLRSENDLTVLRMEKDLVLGGEEWQIDSNNITEKGSGYIYIKDLILARANSSLHVSSPLRSPDSPLSVDFENFDISTISKVMEYREGFLKGMINGEFVLEKSNNTTAFRSDLKITDFVFRSTPVGNITLKAGNSEERSRYDIDLTLKGNGNDIHLNGYYNTKKITEQLDLRLDVLNLSLPSVQPFVSTQLKRMSGDLRGNLAISGNPGKPGVKGTLQMVEVAMSPDIIGTYLRIPEGELVFERDKVSFKNFTMYDSLDRKATLTGYTGFRDIKNPFFDMRLRTDDFLALNTTRKDNPLYFGKIFLKSDISIKGTPALPEIEARIRLNKGSQITYIRPETSVGKAQTDGIIEFTDSLHKHADIMTRQDTALTSEMKGVNLHAVIDIDESVDVKLIVDPLAGDSLYLKGGGLLDFALDPGGGTSLSGKYTISDGGYYLTISNLAKRNFRIDKGSAVTWSGDVLNAYANLSAIYRIKASPIDLVQAETAGMSQSEMNRYRNNLTFLVYLKMRGFISDPEISFDIQLAPEDRGALGGTIDARLATIRENESELNKQVFALLTLRRFIGEDPLSSGSGGGVASASRSSASQILTQQLGALSDKYIDFVDLDLGVNSYEDYSSGQQEGRTQVQVGVSKKLFNDRVTVRVGGNVDVEGKQAKQNNANDVAGNISVEYKLTENGRYRAKAFRESQYENPIEGELTKTGVALIFTREFTRFRNMFKKAETEKRD